MGEKRKDPALKDFAKAFYHSSSWRKVREYVVQRDHGLCQRCKRHGRVEPGEMVHHIVPLTPDNIDDPSISLNAGNLEYVCKVCHEEIHRELEYGALNGRKFEEPRVAFDSMGNVVRI